MIGDALRVELERYVATLELQNALCLAAGRGAFTPEVASRYLVNVRHLIQHTPLHLERATARALARGDRELADHLSHKLAEERGHEAWAERDLERLAREFGIQHPPGIVPALAELLGYLEEIIERDPALYLAYMLFIEYVTAAGAGKWLSVVQARCGIPEDSMTVIAKHVELDGAHSSEGFEAIDALVTRPAMLGPMRAVLLASRQFFDRFCREIVSGTRTGAALWTEAATA